MRKSIPKRRCRATRSLVACVGLCILQSMAAFGQNAPATVPDLKLSRRGYAGFALQADGKLVVGGQFTSINGVSRTNLARLNPNGTVDLTWKPPITPDVGDLCIVGTNLFISTSGYEIGGIYHPLFAKLS